MAGAISVVAFCLLVAQGYLVFKQIKMHQGDKK